MADVDAVADIAAAAASAGSVASAATTRGTTVANSCDNCVYAPPILDALQPRIVMLPAQCRGMPFLMMMLVMMPLMMMMMMMTMVLISGIIFIRAAREQSSAATDSNPSAEAEDLVHLQPDFLLSPRIL